MSVTQEQDALTVPENWDVRPLGETFQLLNGCAFKPSDWKTSGVPIIRIQNLNDREAPFNYSQAPVPEKNRVEPGNLLFAWSGTLGTSFGARIWDGPAGVLNQHIFKVQIDERRVTLPFALLAFARVEDDIAKQAHGFKTSFVHVKKSDLTKVLLPLPPIAEQRAIAEALSDVDEMLTGLNRLIAKKRDLKQATMQQLLTGQTRLPGFKGKWEKTTLGELATFLSGGTPSRSNEEFWKGEIPWISATSLRCFEIWRSDSNVTKEAVAAGSKMAPVGASLLLVRGSALHKEILCGLVSKPVCFNQDVKALVPNTNVVPRFLTIFIRGNAESFLKLVSSAGNTAGVLDTKLLKAFALNLPSEHEQAAIAEVLSDIDSELDALEARRDKTRALKQGMMQELLTGRTRLV